MVAFDAGWNGRVGMLQEGTEEAEELKARL